MQLGIGPYSYVLAVLRGQRLIDNLDNVIDRMLDEGCRIIVCALIAHSLGRLH
jgi:hypothetical protein